jgi:hypothetical protein
MAAAYVVKIPTTRAGLPHTPNGHDAVVVWAATSSDAIAMAKAQWDGDGMTAAWAQATATAIAAGTNLNDYALRIRVSAAPDSGDDDLLDVTILASESVAVKATGTLTLTPGAIADDVVKVNTTYYKFAADPTTGTPDGTVGSPYLVAAGANDTAAFANLRKAINATGVGGVDYAAEIVAPHATVEATASNATTLSARALTAGTAGNAISTTVTATGGADGLAWGATTLLGGEDANSFDTFADRAVVEIDAVAGFTPSYNASSQILTVATIGDDIGDSSMTVEFYDATQADPKSIPGFVGAIVDGGIAGAVLTVAFAADAYSLPGAATKLSSLAA